MTELEYRSHPAISRSELWRMNESPEKFKYFKEHPPETTPAFLFGQLVHKLLLEPDTFADDFAVAPTVDKRTKEGKQLWEAFLADANGKMVVSLDDCDTATFMVNAVKANPLTARLLNGEHEVPFFWTDPDTGEECKCRTDILIRSKEPSEPWLIVDYKTTTDARTDIFNSHIYKFGYHVQAAMYSEGVMRAEGLTVRPQFMFIVQEKKPPFSLNVISAPDDVVTLGLDQFREFIGLYHECKETDYWYGYTGAFNEPNEAYLPGWAQLGIDEED